MASITTESRRHRLQTSALEESVGKKSPIPMLNAIEEIRSDPIARQFEIGALLFAQFACPAQEVGVWTETDYLMHVVSGTTSFTIADHALSVRAGEAVFVTKGAYFIPAHSNGDPCVQLYFIPDASVRETISGLAVDISAAWGRAPGAEGVMRVVEEPALSAFFRAMAVYFAADEAPPEALLTLKLRELLTGILLSQKNSELSLYLQSIAASDAPSLPAIMEANWDHNLPLAAFARLCHRSLSSFKRDFHKHYGQTPARWLLERRLERSFSLLRATRKSVTEIMLECGFEDLSHFSRAFKQKFGHSPSARRRAAVTTS